MGRSKPWVGYRNASRQQSDPKWLKKHGKTKRPDEVDGDSYLKRGIVLLEMGFLSYEAYLQSQLWADIRIAAYQLHGHNCLICKKRADVVHHLDYSLQTMKGFKLNSLVPICEECHKKVEFDGERKRPVHEARQVTLSLLPRKTTKKKCVGCGSEFVANNGRSKRGRRLCKRCCNDRSLD